MERKDTVREIAEDGVVLRNFDRHILVFVFGCGNDGMIEELSHECSKFVQTATAKYISWLGTDDVGDKAGRGAILASGLSGGTAEGVRKLRQTSGAPNLDERVCACAVQVTDIDVAVCTPSCVERIVALLNRLLCVSTVDGLRASMREE